MWPFDNPKDPQVEASKYLNKIEPMLNQQYNPYLQAGRDPAAMQAQLMQGFQQNPGQRFAMDEALKQHKAAMYGQGMGGTDTHQMGAGRLANALMSDNMQQYYNNNRDLLGLGLNATQQYSGDLSNLYGTQGQLGYNQAREENTGWNDILQGLLQGAGGAAMGYATGGPAGAGIGALSGFSGGMNASKGKPGWDVAKFGQDIGKSPLGQSRYSGFASKGTPNQQGQGMPPYANPQMPMYYPQSNGGAQTPLYYPQQSNFF